ncbi:MAG TPA: monofunctional biosynthetic peptidoglycan transglycosylase [Candidatus Deferrimicrobiaceae bacterium]|nr:monofunctional biosynthetic peptidoglycan transglycosylase [Candidatus Deferrimicrobiaceae bacterium]
MRIPRSARSVLLVLAGIVVLWAALTGVSLVFLPSVRPLADRHASIAITVRDWQGKEHPFLVGPRNPYWTPVSVVPASLKKAVIAAEDANFYTHEGVDYEAIREAIKTDIQKGRFVRGGSTITQQLAKNLFLSREKTVSRKIKEYILARRIDDRLSKSRILELYLNVVELGPMIYGVGHASRYYFGKPASALTVRESAFLASMLPGPKVYNPYRNLDRVMRRSDRILRRMVAARMITDEEYRAALAEEPNIEGLSRKVEKTMASPPPEEVAPLPPTEGIPEPETPSPDPTSHGEESGGTGGPPPDPPAEGNRS